MRKIIIVSASNDVHVPLVDKYLHSEPVRIDPLDIIKGISLDYEFRDSKMQVFHDSKVLRDIVAIWYRRPTPVIGRNIPVSDTDKEYTLSAIDKHLKAFSDLFPNALWVSNPAAIRHASSKPLQQIIASKLGFNVPDTLYASNAAQAKQFVDRKKICIAKSQAAIFPNEKFVLAKLIRSTDKIDYSGLNVDPYIFQDFIDPAAELRVTVVGHEVYAARVEGAEIDGIDSAFRDWRYAHWNKTFTASAFTLPKRVATRCISLTHELDLEFGAIDLILDKKGTYWFLEINPNGQWAFAEEATGLPIGRAIARHLEAGATSNARN